MINKDQILARIKSTVAETDPRATVILYGSYARGDYNEDSDIDVLILVDKEKVTTEEEEQFMYSLYKVELQEGVVISPLVYPRQYWEHERRVTPFSENVQAEGVVL